MPIYPIKKSALDLLVFLTWSVENDQRWQKLRQTTIGSRKVRPWRPDSNQMASGKAGAVQDAVPASFKSSVRRYNKEITNAENLRLLSILQSRIPLLWSPENFHACSRSGRSLDRYGSNL